MTTKKAQHTQERILAAASRLFAAASFDAVSVRAIARDADVDPALIHHYFGTKEELFEALLGSSLRPDLIEMRLQDSPRGEWGREVVRFAERVWSSPAAPALIAIVRRSLAGDSTLLRSFATRFILSRISPLLDGEEAERLERANAVVSQMVGLIIARHIIGIEPLASMSAERVVDVVGPNVQRYLTGPWPSAD